MKASPKSAIPALVFAAFGFIAWQVGRAGGDFHLDKGYKVEIVVHGPDGTIIPAIGRAPR